jgi:tetratricopeptide (TPR) repeat protein
MKKLVMILFVVSPLVTLSAQQKYALVFGNGAYRNLARLNNPVNDANDMRAALQELGFNVDIVINGSRIQMEEAIERFKNRLSLSTNSYGFLFYAGHGVQSGSTNYLIPVDADIRSESYLGDRAVSVQAMLHEINQAGNDLNVVVLDACRDNPFSWSRSSTRGLQVVNNQPADSIIVYATSAGSTAADGTGRNGLFTGELLKNLKTPGLEVNEIFRRTGSEVARVSGGGQRPAVYNQFFGVAYLGSRPSTQTTQPLRPQREISQNAVIPAPKLDLGPPWYFMHSNKASAAADERAHSYYYKGDYDQAIVEFTEAIRIEPKNSDYYSNRGIAYYHKGSYDRAIADFTESLRLKTEYPSVDYYSRATAYYAKGNYDQAIADFTEAIRLWSEDSSYYYGRGAAYYRKGNYERAIADFDTKLRLDPSDAITRSSRQNAINAKNARR